MTEEAFHSEEHDAWFLKEKGKKPDITEDTQRWALVDIKSEQTRSNSMANLSTAVSLLDSIEGILAYAESTTTAVDPKTKKHVVKPWTIEQLMEALASYRVAIGTLHTKLQ